MRRGMFQFTGATVAAVALACAACSGGTASGSTDDDGPWTPTESIEYIAPAGAGGGWDTLARTTANVLEGSDLIDTRLPVTNMEGGGGSIGWSHVASKESDPHTLFVTSPPIILVPLSGASPHDHTDFTPIARLIADYSVYGVAADSDIHTAEDLFAAIAADPQGFSVGGGSAVGSMDHIAVAGAAAEAGVSAQDVNYISFEGGGEALLATVGGHTDAVVTDVASAIPLVASGDVRIVAVSSEERVEAMPDVPTLQESGIDFTFDIWRGVMAPAGLTDAQVAYYEQLFADMLELDSWATERDRLGWDDAYMDSAEFEAFLDEQSTQFESILTDIGLSS